MLVLGHAGIALGAAVLIAGGLSSRQDIRSQDADAGIPGSGRLLRLPASWLTWLSRRIDIRLLLLGSILPDIIDKPLGLYLFEDALGNGRIFFHTLLLWFLTTAAAWWLYRARKGTGGLALSFGLGLHLILDEMWLHPATLLWPAYGLAFEQVDAAEWVRGLWEALLSAPGVYVPEAIGALILLWFAVAVAMRRELGSFVKNGRIV